MAEEEKKEGQKKGGILKTLFGEKADRIATFATVGGLVAYAGKQLLNKAATRLTEKGIDVAEKKIEEIVLGKDTAAAKKSREDEKYWEMILSQRSDKEEIRKFRSELRVVSVDKSDALILHAANLVTGFRREVIKVTYKKKKGDQDRNGKEKKGKGGPHDKTEEKLSKFDFKVVNSFLNSLMNDHKTFPERERFLEDESVFELIPKTKTLMNSIKAAGSRVADKIACKTVITSKKVKKATRKNSKDWKKTTGDLKAKAKNWRDAANQQQKRSQ